MRIDGALTADRDAACADVNPQYAKSLRGQRDRTGRGARVTRWRAARAPMRHSERASEELLRTRHGTRPARPGPMRNTATLLLVLLVACASGDLDTSTEQDGLICDPWCDPSNPDPETEATLHAAYNYGYGLFSDAVWQRQGCIELQPGTECLVVFSTASSPCGSVTVDCNDLPIHGRNRVSCDWSVGGCD